MDFAWSPEVRHRAERAQQFAEEKLLPLPQPKGLDRAAWNALAAFGVLRMPLPKAWGGESCGALTTIAVLEALGRGGADRGLLFAAGAHLLGCAVPLAAYGTPRHAERWGEGLSNGTVIGALAVTEISGGSSLDLLNLQATEASGGFVLSGEKTLIANAPE